MEKHANIQSEAIIGEFNIPSVISSALSSICHRLENKMLLELRNF